MYKYSRMRLSNEQIKEVKNKREFLYNKHQEIAEGYEQMIEKQEAVNKLVRFRKTLISYAEGKNPQFHQFAAKTISLTCLGNVLETGCGTGKNSKFYKPDANIIAVDWSKNMIQEALGKDYDTKKIQYKIADVENLPFENESFDTVVDTFSLQR